MGGGIFAENGSEIVENDQTGLPPWAVALIAQIQTTLAAQLAAQAQAHRAELQELVAECRASAHDACLAKAQLQDQRDEIEAMQEQIRAALFFPAHKYTDALTTVLNCRILLLEFQQAIAPPPPAATCMSPAGAGGRQCPMFYTPNLLGFYLGAMPLLLILFYYLLV